MNRLLDDIARANLDFVQSNRWDKFPQSGGKPARKLAIFTCMDCRLADFVLPALGLQRGDAKVIKSAGNTFDNNESDSVIVSLAIAVIAMDVEEILVVGHYDCGVGKLDAEEFACKMKERNMSVEAIDRAVQVVKLWIGNTTNIVDSVRNVCYKIKSSPIMPAVPVHGLLIHPLTGMIQVIANGYKNL